MRKRITELTTSSQWIQCECGNAYSHKDECGGRTRRKFLVQSDVEDDSYWLCSHCAGSCVWGNPPELISSDDGMITDLEGLGRLLGRYLK